MFLTASDILGLVLLLMSEGRADAFYHEPSKKTIPSPLQNHSEFGFAMAYQPSSTAKLIVGAPRADLDGQVYSCSIGDVLSIENPVCTKLQIDIKSIHKPGLRFFSENQEFWMGASLAATSEYVFVCAPLWSGEVPGRKSEHDRRTVYIKGSFGHCFVYDKDNVTKSLNGPLEETGRAKTVRQIQDLMAGFGWSIKIDESTEQLFVGKPAGDNGLIAYANLKDVPGTQFGVSRKSQYKLKKYRHAGNAFAFGNYFTDINQTMLAFSLTSDLVGTIIFGNYTDGSYELVPGSGVRDYFELRDDTVGSMFGEAVCAADVSGDGHAELFVGAPAYSDSVKRADLGAVHVYKSGNLAKIALPERKFTIIGMQEGGHFGRAIVSAGDLDSDGFSDICIGAPYEDAGAGAVYVLSGVELYKILEDFFYRSLKLNEMKLVQRLKRTEAKRFGFSLLPLPDVDGNGCNELAVGSPRADSITIYRCIPAIKIFINMKLLNFETVPENTTSFNINVCYTIMFPSKPDIITSKLVVTNNITGDAVTLKNNTQYTIQLRTNVFPYCKEVAVDVSNNIPGYYDFYTTYKFDVNSSEVRDFDPGWVRVYSESPIGKSLRIARGCNTAECTPRLTALLTSTIGEANTTYILSSTAQENVTLIITNEGDSAYLACVRITVDGPSARIDCVPKDNGNGHVCNLPRPFHKDEKFQVKMQLDMTTMTNMNKKISINAIFDKNCDENNVTENTLSYDVQTYIMNIVLEGTDKEWIVTLNDTITNKTKYFEHVYTITNNDIVLWQNLKARIVMTKQKYLQYLDVVVNPNADDKRCIKKLLEDRVTFKCDYLFINPKSFTKITVPLILVPNDASEYIDSGLLVVTSAMKLFLTPTEHILYQNISHTFQLQKERLRIDQKKNVMLLIFIILGLLLLLMVAIALYKCGFFKRKDKQKLEELKEEVRRKSVRRNQLGSRPEDSVDGENQLQSSNAHENGSVILSCERVDDDSELLVDKNDERECFENTQITDNK